MFPTEARPALCVSIHDVAPSTWPACARLLDAMRAVADIPVSLLVVPDYHRLPVADEAPYRSALDACVERGDELVLHGYHHFDDGAADAGWRDGFTRKIYTRSEGEFFAISRDEARRRIARGLAWFGERGWPVRGFVAPAWLMGPQAWDALLEFPFEYTTTLRRFWLLPQRRALASQSLVYSAGSTWRRQVSSRWNSLLYRALGRRPLVRLSLHPVDARHPQLVRHAQSLLASLLADREAMTKLEFARRWRAQLNADTASHRSSAGHRTIPRSSVR
jgi:uncharacterized protein